MNWKKEAERLLFQERLTWTQITDAMKKYFPKMTERQVYDKVRTYLRSTDKYKTKNDTPTYRETIEYRQDGSVTRDKLIEICEGEELTPEAVVKAHGLKVEEWEVISYRNNYWNSQTKDGIKITMYQSKLTVKPKKDGISFEAIDKHFEKLSRDYKPPKITYIKHDRRLMAEVNIADLHLGKLCWHGDTGNNFDYKIARDIFYEIVNEISGQLKDIELIRFVWCNDYFNSDTIEKTTTGGTPQDTDVRWQKLFNVGVEMLVNAVETLRQIAPVETFYLPSNHDEVTAYHALKYLEAWFRGYNDVEVEINASPRKYKLYGNNLIGYTHGDKEKGNGTREKASRLASLMPIEARELWSKARYYEMHTAHLHSEHAIQEINGVIVRRISAPTATDTWHCEGGYLGAVRKAQTFIFDYDRVLLNNINTPVILA